MQGRTEFQQQKLQTYEIRQNQYQNTWKVPLMDTILKKPLWCIFSAFCPNCVSYLNRKQALYGDMTRYICCAGHCPCSGKMKEQECPEFCLGMEVCFCFTQSVASTRWMIQDEQRIQNTKCDNCLIGAMVTAQYLACLCDIAACLSGSQEVAELAHCTDNIAQVLWCSVCACMQTQVKVQMDERDAGGHAAPNPLQPPGQQTMGYSAYAGPPQGGPPPQQQQQQQQGPPQHYPQYPQYPPQGQGQPNYPQYPPQGYPPQQGYPGGPQQMTRY
ncbi:g4604 [Coccomyxa viridis]|uniref:G4604 protein n=1 Tax=Coccomyxa viridis TaxID=1274662 RepID=A0ABP1FS73_9CHLO